MDHSQEESSCKKHSLGRPATEEFSQIRSKSLAVVKHHISEADTANGRLHIFVNARDGSVPKSCSGTNSSRSVLGYVRRKHTRYAPCRSVHGNISDRIGLQLATIPMPSSHCPVVFRHAFGIVVMSAAQKAFAHSLQFTTRGHNERCRD